MKLPSGKKYSEKDRLRVYLPFITSVNSSLIFDCSPLNSVLELNMLPPPLYETFELLI